MNKCTLYAHFNQVQYLTFFIKKLILVINKIFYITYWKNESKRNIIMGNRSTGKVEGFGERLRQLRKQVGLTQEQLARKANLSRRMIVYYESQGGEPDAHLIVKIAKTLNVSTDMLLGNKNVACDSPKKLKLWRSLLKVENLPEKDQKMITEMIEALEVRNREVNDTVMVGN